MKKFKKLMGKKFLLSLAIMLSISLFFAAGGCWNDTEEKEESTNEEETVENSEENEIFKEGEVKLYFTEDTGTSFVMTYEEREVEKVTPKEVMQMYLDGPEDEDLFGIFGDVSLLGLEIEDETAYVDFSGELLDISLGSEAEGVFVATIVYNLTQFDGIEKVQIMVEGDIVETISGHVSIDEPLAR